MSVARLLIPLYIQHSALYSIWIFLWMNGSAADSAMSCKQFSNPDTETTVFKDDGCFLLSRENRTWEESKTFCNGLGDGWSLVEIEDVETQKHVDSVSRTAGVSTGSWIGLRQRKGFTWESGNKLGNTDFFKRLAAGEVQSTGDCVTTSPPDDTSLYGTWSHMDCTARLYSICHTGSPQPPRKTTTCRPTASSKPPAKPPTTVKYGAGESTTTTTQSTETTMQSTASNITSTAASTQSTETTMQSTASNITSTATSTQSTAATTQSTASTTQSTASITQSTASITQSTAAATQSTAAATTQSTAATTTTMSVKTGIKNITTSSTTVLIAVSSTAASVAAVFLVGGLIALCRRNKQKRLRVTMAADDTESGTVADVRTKPEVEYAVVTKIQTKQPSQVHACNTESGYHYASVDDGALPMKQGVNDQTYDTATITEKKQPITFDNTYARAMFSQSASDTGDDVYDHTRVTGKASQEVDASHYDHAFVK